jgi:hypothetical protein
VVSAGITSTPVIDPETNIVYVMSLSIEGTTVDSAAYRCLSYKESLPGSLAETALLTGCFFIKGCFPAL